MKNGGTPDELSSVTAPVELSDASGVIEALSSSTARTILEVVYEEPGTATDIADRVDTSVQNASYHLDHLVQVDLLETSHQRPAQGSRPLEVYEPTDEQVVLLLGADEQEPAAVGAIQDVESTV